jgi:hypothetical protein
MPMRPDRKPEGTKYQCRGNSRVVTSTNKPCPSPVTIRAKLADGAVREWLAALLSEETDTGRAALERALAARSAKADVDALQKSLDVLKATRRNYIRLRAAEQIDSDEELSELLTEVDAKIETQRTAIAERNRQVEQFEIPGEEIFRAVLSGWERGHLDESAINKALTPLLKGVYVGHGHFASSPQKLDIVATWEDREPQVFLGPVRGVDHDAGKHCSRCLEWKSADGFYRRKSGRDANALTSWCRECSKEYMRTRHPRAELAKRRRESRARQRETGSSPGSAA